MQPGLHILAGFARPPACSAEIGAGVTNYRVGVQILEPDRPRAALAFVRGFTTHGQPNRISIGGWVPLQAQGARDLTQIFPVPIPLG